MMRYLFILLIFLSACKKSEDRACLKFKGESAEKRIDLDSFDKLGLGPYLTFVLVQDTVDYVLLSGGKNLINFVPVKQDNQLVTISNENKCKSLRKDKSGVKAEIHFKSIFKIVYNGSTTLSSLGTISVPKLIIEMKEGAGSLTLDVDCNVLNVSAEPSWADYTISGKADNARLTVKGNAFGNTTNLKISNQLTVMSRSAADLYVNFDGVAHVKCETWSNGNVYYVGMPQLLQWNDYGNGKLLDAN